MSQKPDKIIFQQMTPTAIRSLTRQNGNARRCGLAFRSHDESDLTGLGNLSGLGTGGMPCLVRFG